MDKWNNSILFLLAIKCFEFCFISMVIIVYRIGVGMYLLFRFRTLDLAIKNISLIILFDQAAYLFLSFKTFTVQFHQFTISRIYKKQNFFFEYYCKRQSELSIDCLQGRRKV